MIPEHMIPIYSYFMSTIDLDQVSPNQSKVNIVVDCREAALIARMNTVAAEYAAVPNGIIVPIETKALAIGDIVFMDSGSGSGSGSGLVDDRSQSGLSGRDRLAKEMIVFERKTLQDLLASIKDGRYEEQSHRLIHTSGVAPHNIVYIIEGLMSQLKSDAERRLIFSTMTSLSFFKGFSVMRTSTVQETADLLMAMAHKIHRDIERGRRPNQNHTHSNSNEQKMDSNVDQGVSQPNQNSYSHFVKKEKKENITEENIAEIMLSQIPGVSASTAKEIMVQTGGTFLSVIEECSSSAPFQNVVLTGTNGKTRKLGSNVREALVKYLMKMK